LKCVSEFYDCRVLQNGQHLLLYKGLILFSLPFKFTFLYLFHRVEFFIRIFFNQVNISIGTSAKGILDCKILQRNRSQWFFLHQLRCFRRCGLRRSLLALHFVYNKLFIINLIKFLIWSFLPSRKKQFHSYVIERLKSEITMRILSVKLSQSIFLIIFYFWKNSLLFFLILKNIITNLFSLIISFHRQTVFFIYGWLKKKFFYVYKDLRLQKLRRRRHERVEETKKNKNILTWKIKKKRCQIL